MTAYWLVRGEVERRFPFVVQSRHVETLFDHLETAADRWCEENIGGTSASRAYSAGSDSYHYSWSPLNRWARLDIIQYYFLTEVDAVAFKLRWG